MRDPRKDIPDTAAATDAGLEPNFTLEEWQAEILGSLDIAQVEPRQPGDVSARDVLDLLEQQGKVISERTALIYLQRLGKKPGWKMMRVYDSQAHRFMQVARKVE